MKFAPIGPFGDPFLEVYAKVHWSYHLALAQHVLSGKQRVAYTKFFASRARYGDHVILDNGAAENARPAFAEVVDAAKMIGAHEIVLPDELRDSKATLALVEAAMPQINTIHPLKRLVIPQGNTMEEMVVCMQALEALLKGKYGTIGLPKHAERFDGGRGALIFELSGVGINLTQHPIHLFGVWEDPFSEMRSAATAAVFADALIRGIDSGVPFAAAQNDVSLAGGVVTKHYSLSAGDPFLVTQAQLNCEAVITAAGALP